MPSIMLLFRLIYKVLQKFAKVAGFNLAVTKESKKTGSYELVFPKATYAPWLSDRPFNEIYDTVKDYTLVDKYRCYELWQLAAECSKLNGALIEVGVWRGGSGCLIAKRAQTVGINDNVYLCDTFRGVVKAGERDSRYKGGEHADSSKEIVEGLIDTLKLDNAKILVGTFPEETANLIDDKIFRFCHIDVDVYQSAKDIVDWLWPRLAVGGMVVFDDYGFWACEGVTRFVDQERNKKDRTVIQNLNGHAILIKISNV